MLGNELNELSEWRCNENNMGITLAGAGAASDILTSVSADCSPSVTIRPQLLKRWIALPTG